MHAGSFQSQTNEVIAGGLDHPHANLAQAFVSDSIFLAVSQTCSRMIPIQKAGCFAKVSSLDLPTPATAVDSEYFFTGLPLAILAGQSP